MHEIAAAGKRIHTWLPLEQSEPTPGDHPRHRPDHGRRFGGFRHRSFRHRSVEVSSSRAVELAAWHWACAHRSELNRWQTTVRQNLQTGVTNIYAGCSLQAPCRSSAMRNGAARRDLPWLTGIIARKQTKVAAVALANKIARMVWALLKHGGTYQRPVTVPACLGRRRGIGR